MADVTITHPLNPSSIQDLHKNGVTTKLPSGQIESKVLVRADKRKRSKYKELIQQEGCHFQTLGLESYGRVSSGFLSFIAQIATDSMENGQLDISLGQYKLQMMQELSFTLQQGNGKAAIAHMRDADYLPPADAAH
jgi:hypothetical protein